MRPTAGNRNNPDVDPNTLPPENTGPLARQSRLQSILASPLLPIFLIVLVDVLGFTIILPLLPFYSEKLGATPTVIGEIVAVYAICQLISGPILGQLSDRFGRRPVLLVSQAGTLAGFFLLAWAHQVWLLFVARAVDGATAGNLTTAQAYISDVTKPENRAKAFALIGIAFGFGFLVGPALSGFLAGFGYRVPILLACGLSFLSILCTYFLLPRREPIHAAPDDVGPGGKRLSLISWGEYIKYFRNPQLSPLLLQWLLFAFSFSTFISGFALFCERAYRWNGHPVGAREVGFLFAFNGFLGIIMQGGVVGRMVKVMGERNVVRLGFLIEGLIYTAVGFTDHIWEAVVLMIIGAGASGLRPALTSMITQRGSQREQGVIIGLTQSLTSIAQIIAPLIAGFLINMADQHAPGAPEKHLYLEIWAVWGGALGLAALLIEPKKVTTPEPAPV